MTKERRQQVLLAALLSLLVIFGGRAALRLVAGDGGAGVAAGGGRSAGDGQSVADVEVLRLADLELEPQTFQLGRDPFQFVVEAPPPRQQPPPRAAPPPRPRVPPNQAQQTPPRPQPPPGSQPPPVDVVYLGRFGPVDRPIAVFSDGKEIFNAREGGVLKDAFVVDKIGFESADLKFVGFPKAPSKRLAVGG